MILGGACAAAFAFPAAPAAAAPACPNPVPVVNENNCQGAGSTAWRLSKYDGNAIAGFATKTSVNRGQDVTLKVARNGAAPGSTSVNVSVFRMGYYGGTGGRLISAASRNGVSVNNGYGCQAMDSTTGRVSCANWGASYTIPGSSLPASGVYLVKLKTTDTGVENYVVFTVRDDARSPKAKVLYQLPVATYQAYNGWGGKSFYNANSFGANTVSGTPRAVKVSFDRPFDNLTNRKDFFLAADYPLLYWLEREGYDVSYSDDVQSHLDGSTLTGRAAVAISGHDEYWSLEQFNNVKAARDAAVDIASFSSNTAYWKVRYEDSARTLVGYKTVQGTTTSGSAATNGNDWGPDGQLNTADDALGADHKVGGTGANTDHPENSTTTWRDNGAPNGDPNAPPGGRVGPDKPENQLFGVMYIGDNDGYFFGLNIPAANAAGEFSGDRIWRNTNIPTTTATYLNRTGYVGWEWDAVPTQSQYTSRQPAGVKRLSNTDVKGNGSGFIQDEGRVYGTTPPSGLPGTVNAVKYTAPSGALVFASGTIQWSWGLGPHFEVNAQAAPLDETEPRLQQATYNVLSDMGVAPNTPAGIVQDGGANTPPAASFTYSPSAPLAGDSVSFDGSGSSDPNGSIAKYEWDLDGNGTLETNSGTSPRTSHTYTAAGTVSVTLRVTDNSGATATAARSIAIGSPPPSTASYAQTVQGTAGLVNYWRMGETSGTSFADSKGTGTATESNAQLGVPGAIAGDSNGAARFNDASSFAQAPVNLSTTGVVSVEFWLKWNAFDQDDDLAMELTPNFNSNAGGFLIDPDESASGQGKFGAAVRQGAANSGYNNAFFARPSAAQWHHYVLVFDKTQTAANEISAYVDGGLQGVTKTDSTETTDNFANSTLYFMSRAGSALFGGGDLDEVAIYNRALDAATVANHHRIGTTAPVGNQAPTASFVYSPSAPTVGQAVTFNGSGSSDPDGSIAKYEWDLDGNGTFETNTGTTATVSKTYTSAATIPVALRVTDNVGATSTATKSVTISPQSTTTYAQLVQGTSGLIHYWRMGEASGTSFADSKGTSTAAQSNVQLGVPGAIAGDTNGAARFNDTSSFAQAPVDLSATGVVSVELWLKWNAYDQDDDLAMEFTPNFNSNAGGFLVDPDESASGQGLFGVAERQGATNSGYNNGFFTRPSAAQWHHYVLVFDKTQAGANEITVYVDGAKVSVTKIASTDTTDTFANSTLYFMSRAGAALFGGGDLDEVALYDRALDATTVAAHYQKGATG